MLFLYNGKLGPNPLLCLIQMLSFNSGSKMTVKGEKRSQSLCQLLRNHVTLGLDSPSRPFPPHVKNRDRTEDFAPSIKYSPHKPEDPSLIPRKHEKSRAYGAQQ